jgi:hypothetical protein
MKWDASHNKVGREGGRDLEVTNVSGGGEEERRRIDAARRTARATSG